MSRVCVIGLGYIGLPMAAMLASRGHAVLGCDLDARVVAGVNAGQAHFQEPDLDMLLAAAVQTGRLRAVTRPAEAEFFVIAVPTPFDAAHRPDLSCVDAATAAIAPVLKAGDTVILESTSPVGTTERIAAQLAALRPDLVLPRPDAAAPAGCVHLVHCPERILPGALLRELVQNDRILGGVTPDCARRARTLYESFVTGRIHLTDCRSAELCKLAENAFRDVNIAFANELSLICERLGIDVWELRRLANNHPRVDILQPGPGVGGHCIAVDPWFIIAAAPQEARLIRTARAVNDAKTEHVLDQIRMAAARHSARAGRPARIACLGLAFKANVADLRESPALRIVEALAHEHPGRIMVVEPHLRALPESLAGRVRLAGLGAALADADVCALLVDHDAFRAVPRPARAGLTVVDTRGLWSGGPREARTGSGNKPLQNLVLNLSHHMPL